MNRTVSLAANIIRSNVKRLPTPYKLTYAITYRCNSRCELCQIWKKPATQELTNHEIQRFFSRNPFFNWIDITGGEVFLRPDLIPIIKTIIETQPNLYLLHMPTNGLLAEKVYETTKQILALKPKRFIISISLDGPKKIHDKLRGIPGGWERAVKTYQLLSTLRSSNFSIYFGCTVSGYNEEYLNEMLIELKQKIPSITHSDIHINVAHQSSHYYANEKKQLEISSKSIKLIQRFLSTQSFSLNPISLLEHFYQQYIPAYISTRKTPLPCKSLSSSLFLSPDGIIYPCSMWSYPLGNIKSYDFKIINMWNTESVKKAILLIQRKKCANCWTPCEAYQTILGNTRSLLSL